ncbi:ABC transporter ATP-binding protein [Bacillus sp. MUM 13]|uniref:ABC transporter ATP-binding protein n=1 Tax=Bacillus sp. MUM 13 TaxID=1678001 RepID=UPI0008F5CCF8|nr:ABC transporter ATP-binding protein [Bacillus sp. MUM 13]OIK09593.1 ABC transporter ATP-binding protein [Bacillus sp. MUM 13]
MLKGLLEKLKNPKQKSLETETKPFSQEEIEALVDARLKEHAESLKRPSSAVEDLSLTAKQIEFALSLIAKIGNEYVLATEPDKLTLKDLNKLIAYNRYKNKGILINLAKKGVLRKV